MGELLRATRRAWRRRKEWRQLQRQLEKIAAAQELLEFRLAVSCWERAGSPKGLKAPVSAVKRLQNRKQRVLEKNREREQALEELRRERERLEARREGQISRLAEEISGLEQRRSRAERMLEHCEFQREKLRDRITQLDREDVRVIKRLQQLQELGGHGAPEYAETADAAETAEAGSGEPLEAAEKQELEARRKAIPEEQEALEHEALGLDPEIEKCRREQDVTFERLLALERTRKSALRGYLRRELHLTRREEQMRRELLHNTRFAARMEQQAFSAFQQVGAYLAEKGIGSEEQKHVLPGILALRAETEEIQHRLQEIQEEAGRDAPTWATLRLAVLLLVITALVAAAGLFTFQGW
jgi:hypothetical protein